VTSAIVVKGLLGSRWLVEIEAEAVLAWKHEAAAEP